MPLESRQATAAAFHDITLGNNTNACCNANKFFASPGYDLCTGWGTPTGSNLISALLAPPAALRITPAAPLTFTGPFGGPFRPASQGFLLTNDSNALLSWTVTNPATWLNVSPASGTLTNGGPAATVTVTLTSAASSLPVGSYIATLWFTNVNSTNLNDRLGQSRQVSLDIVAPPVITSQPTNQTVFQGMTVSFTVGISNSASCSYQWRYDNGLHVTNLTDGGNITGSATSTLVINDAMPADAGAYSVIVSNAAGAVSSSNAFLAVLPWRPVITAQPSSQTVLAGERVTFTVAAAGIEPLFYLWQRDGISLADGGNISGSASSSLTLRSASLADAGTYAVVVGNAYGLATSSGAVLTVISITAPGTGLTTVYSFTGGNDGANPNGLLRAANGSFYGTTQNGGTNLAGTVFQMAASGTVTGLYSFTGGDDGATPFAALAQAPDGNFYGTTYQGGAYDNGTVFRMTPSGVLANLFRLTVSNGALPYAGLVLGSDSNFYGTTYQGGAAGRGTAFSDLHQRRADDPAFVQQWLGWRPRGGGVAARQRWELLRHHLQRRRFRLRHRVPRNARWRADHPGVVQLREWRLSSGGAGAGPRRGISMAQPPAGALTTMAWYSECPRPGVLNILYSFGGGTDGSYPAAALLQGSDGNFYGTTAYGGAYGDGTVFRMTPAGTLTTLVAFDGYAGANPQAAMIEDADGSLLGTTQNGGADDEGVIFRLSFTGPPQITAQPVSQSVYVGDDVMLSVAVSGVSPFSYQWQKNGTNLVDGGNIIGSNSRVLSLDRR